MTSHQPTILIVDPDPRRAAPITRALSHEGFRLMPLTSEEDALTLCRSKRFPVDLVVTPFAAQAVCGLQIAQVIAREHLPIEILRVEVPGSDVEIRARVYHALKLQKPKAKAAPNPPES